MNKTRLRGLYAITDTTLQHPDQLTERVSRAIAGGASLIQYRDKSTNAQFRLRQARALAQLCNDHDVPLIINDDIQLAAECNAQGVHLGKDDTDAHEAREILGETAIIGVSCYNEFSRAVEAADQAVDYIAFGRFFPSATKPKAVQAELDLIHKAKQQLPLPVVAIGGITPTNAEPLLQAGVDMIAVVQGVFAAHDIKRAASEYQRLFN